MGRFEDILWHEDLDTSGGPAAIETCLNQYAGWTRTGADAITSKGLEGIRLVRIMTADETPLTAAGFGDIACTPALVQGDLSLPLCTPDLPGILNLRGGGIVIPPSTQLDVLGNGSGGAAEQHAVVLRMWNPHGQSQFVHKQPPANAERWLVEMALDANTADTMDNPVDICGRSNAYTNGNTAIPNDSGYEVYLHSVRDITIAGQCGFFLLPPGSEHAYIYCQPTLSNPVFDFEKEFGAPFYMTANSPILIGQYGTVNTANQVMLELSIVRPK